MELRFRKSSELACLPEREVSLAVEGNGEFATEDFVALVFRCLERVVHLPRDVDPTRGTILAGLAVVFSFG